VAGEPAQAPNRRHPAVHDGCECNTCCSNDTNRTHIRFRDLDGTILGSTPGAAELLELWHLGWGTLVAPRGLSLGDRNLRPFRPANTRQSPDPGPPALDASSVYRHIRPEETAMYPSTTVSYDLAQARIADLRHQARRDGLARAAARTTRPDRTRVPGRLHRPVRRHRAAPAAG